MATNSFPTVDEPLAVVGMSFRMPQGVVDESSFWEVLANRKNLSTIWPEERLGISDESALDAGDIKKPKTVHVPGAHFIEEDLAAFDAPFFSITAKEAAAMDPQQRWALEVAYHAFENAGMPVESLRGSRTAVFATTFSDDYSRMSAGDDDAPPHSATGNSRSIFANRISWHFDLRGPSVFVDTACSASITALGFACQAIQNGDASSALVLASNMMLSPEMSVAISKLGILSPDGRCFSFDARGNGYARGEGVIAIVIKPIDAALRDGDTIRAVIRGTGTNQDGRTPILTQPSALAQEALIRHVYAKAGLGFGDTRYFEAHGTGTPTGDPIEMSAIGKVFQSSRSLSEPLFVGSVKANIGHLEGASGLAGVVKSIMSLEKGVIPPNALFETINPAIDADALNVRIPIQCVPWPQQGPRRISVNSFGFGGSNAHVILDGASQYLESQGLAGYHYTNGTHTTTTSLNNGNPAKSGLPRLLVWSAADSNTLRRLVGSYRDYFEANIAGRDDKLSRLAYTLASRRSGMAWRKFAVVDDSFGTDTTSDEARGTSLDFPTEPSIRTSVSPDGRDGIAFIFTGQGAQYAGMGLELVRYPVFEESLRRSDDMLANLGCAWSVFDQLSNSERINRPEVSQPLCTVLQIALVQLLRSFGITPAAVIGHSSGEIAAGYSIGALSYRSAVKVAYFRGQVAQKLVDASKADPGAMLAANLTPAQVPDYLQQLESEFGKNAVHIACYNSPNNVTVSGPLATIDALKRLFDEQGVFARVLTTGIAYHSLAMQGAVAEYRALMGSLEATGDDSADDQSTGPSTTIMVSSVTGALVAPKLLGTPQYWIDNLVSPVRFSQAVQLLLSSGKESSPALPLGINQLTDLVEIGPHSALKWPLTDTLDTITSESSSVRYHSVLERKGKPLSTVLSLLGRLFCLGHSAVSILAGNNQARGEIQSLVDCPPYPFDHSRRFWTESRMSKDSWFRVASPGYLLGKRSHDWNPLQPRWKTWLSIEAMPWLADHVVNGTTVCPATGMLVIAIEAILQHHAAALPTDSMNLNGKPTGIVFKTAEFLAPIYVGDTRNDATETELHLSPGPSSSFDVSIFAYHSNRWSECFRASVQLQVDQTDVNQVDGGRERRLNHEQIRDQVEETFKSSSARPIDSLAFYKFCADSGGIKYGETFQQLCDVAWDGDGQSVARIPLSELPTPQVSGNSPVHPAVFDAALHLGIVQLSRGLTAATPTLVPHRLTNLWISPTPWGAETSSLRLSTVLQRMERGALGSLKVITDEGEPLCSIEKLTWSEVSKASNTIPDEDDDADKAESTLLYGIEWMPQLSSQTPRQLQQICDESAKSVSPTISWSQMEYAMRVAVRRVLLGVSDGDLEGRPEHIVRYVTTIRRQYGSTPEDETLDDSEIEALLDECEAKQPAWGIFPTVVRSLRSIIRGEVDPLELLFTTNSAVKTFYWWVFDAHMADGRFRRFLDLASHEKPGMKILEIGAGTGGMTRHILGQLQDFERATGQSRFTNYVFTDISAVFFDAARLEFASCKDRLSFRTLDIERDPTSQGFEPGSYDIIVAASVLHVTSDITASLNRVRSLLKPGGRLVLQETIRPDSASVNVCFGSLEGWWMSKEDWRQDGPLATEPRWEEAMRAANFSGIDLLLRDDGGDEESRFSSVMVTTATNASVTTGQGSGGRQPVVLLVDPASDSGDLQQATAAEILVRLPSAKIVSLADITATSGTAIASISANTIVISLVEVAGSSHLGFLSETSFVQLKELLLSIENMIWAASGQSEAHADGHDMDLPFDPRVALSQGLLRSVRNEDNSKHLVSLIFDSDNNIKYSPADAAGLVVEVLESCFLGDAKSSEVEFIGRNGQLNIGRMKRDVELEKQRVARLKPQFRMENWRSGGPSVVLEMGTPGMLDTMRFAEDVVAQQALGSDEIEVKASACPIGLDDVSIALGRLGGQKVMGLMCAGIVTRTGLACSNSQVQTGDSVVMVTPGCMRSHPRAKSDSVFKIPGGLPVHDAVAIIAPGATAFHSLVNIARLQEGEAVLIHSAASAIGQMAVGIARMVGAEVFVTVSSEDKKQLVVERFGIPEDHILFSGDAFFAHGIMRQTGGRGVDVVLNSLSADSLQDASWECLAPYGRFVEISGKVGKGSSGLAIAMSSNLKNLTFAVVDFQHIVMNNAKLTRQLVDTILDLVSRGQVQPPFPLRVYPVSETEKAFRHIYGGNDAGSTIVSMGGDDVVPKFMRLKSTWSFDADASYLFAGGLGGIGRVLLAWMVDRGARNLVVPSRSGASSKAARDLISEVTSKGVRILAPCCDVSSKTQVAQMLDEFQARNMPPIKGCINAAMVLQDSIFENMTHEQWSTTIRSKVDATWNLHQLLPDNMDFFILLSSLSGIQGTMGQSNYVAGCTFQDALAHARTAAGYQNSISLDLGWVRPVGDMTEHNANSILKIIPIEMPDLVAVMEHCCNPSPIPSNAHDLSPGQVHWQRSSRSQILVGVTLHAHYIDRGMIPPPMLDAPLFSGFTNVRFTRTKGQGGDGSQPGRKNFALLFSQAAGGSRGEREGIVVSALQQKLAEALGVTPEDVDERKSFSEYGVDSLMAVELRNWMRKDFGAAVAVFEMMNAGRSIKSVAGLVVEGAERAEDGSSS